MHTKDDVPKAKRRKKGQSTGSAGSSSGPGLGDLPPEMLLHIRGFLPDDAAYRASQVSHGMRLAMLDGRDVGHLAISSWIHEANQAMACPYDEDKFDQLIETGEKILDRLHSCSRSPNAWRLNLLSLRVVALECVKIWRTIRANNPYSPHFPGDSIDDLAFENFIRKKLSEVGLTYPGMMQITPENGMK